MISEEYESPTAITKTNPIKYFDKQDPEEEDIITLADEDSLYYERLENLYNEIVPLDYCSQAKKKVMSEITRVKVNKSNKNFTYGEMTFRTMAYIFEVIRQKFGKDSIKPGDFYDLGSVKLMQMM